MNYWAKTFAIISLLGTLFAAQPENKEPSQQPTLPKPQGWSFDIGGSYTWISFSTPPTYSGSAGGVLGKISYQLPNSFFGQARSFYNIGPLSSSVNDASFQESYSEFVGGYCIPALKNWTVTPYVGLGFDFLFDDHTGYSTIAPINLNYTIYYAVAGFKTHYTWPNWMLGLQVDCFPTFNQYLKIAGLSGAAWTLDNRVGVEVQLPVAYRYIRNYWLELTPYYRFFPIGASSVLGLPERNLNQVGALVSFRFFL
ncbi:MAG: hypothetical protein HY069_03410 [Chlamydiia bacterium]|nr:hypothetical protein [Chlamydiia bacterium]